MSLLCLSLSSIRRTKSHPENTQDVCKKSKTVVARGFQALPIEILLEIISYTRAPDIPWPNLRPPDPACSERRKTILALSSVCRSLRTALIPVLWETIEACTAPGARVDDRPQRRKRWWKTVYKSTVRQLEAVCNRQPSYASYVKTLNILITPYCISTLARELSRTLPLFPNLTTIQITSLWWIDLCPRKRIRRLSNPTGRNSSDSSYLSLHLKSSFKHLILPNVHTILLPSAATPVLSSFPNARQAYLNDTLETCYPPSHALSLQQSHIQRIDSVLVFIHLLGYFCPKIETFQWAINDSPSSIWTSILLRIYHKFVCLAMVKCLDGLTNVELYLSYHDLDVIKAIERLKDLDQITLRISSTDEDRIYRGEMPASSFDEMVNAAQEVLAGSPSKRRKMLVVRCGEEEIKIVVDQDSH